MHLGELRTRLYGTVPVLRLARPRRGCPGRWCTWVGREWPPAGRSAPRCTPPTWQCLRALGGRPDRRPRGWSEGPVTAPGPHRMEPISSPSANQAHFFVTTIGFGPPFNAGRDDAVTSVHMGETRAR